MQANLNTCLVLNCGGLDGQMQGLKELIVWAIDAVQRYIQKQWSKPYETSDPVHLLISRLIRFNINGLLIHVPGTRAQLVIRGCCAVACGYLENSEVNVGTDCCFDSALPRGELPKGHSIKSEILIGMPILLLSCIQELVTDSARFKRRIVQFQICNAAQCIFSSSHILTSFPASLLSSLRRYVLLSSTMRLSISM